MVLGFLSDAHSHIEAFLKGYRFLKSYADKIYYLGDFVGYFPLSNQVIDIIRQDEIPAVKGNHDAMLLGEIPLANTNDAVYKIAESRALISKVNYDYLASLPSFLEVNTPAKKLLLTHGSPFNHLNGYVYAHSDLTPFAALEYDTFFLGHTHCPFHTKFGSKDIVNVGSVGFSRLSGDFINVVLYDTVTLEVSIKFIEINVIQVLKQYQNSIHQNIQNVLKRN